MLYVTREAVNLCRDNPEAFRRLQRRAMEQDFGWSGSAQAYLAMYESVC